MTISPAVMSRLVVRGPDRQVELAVPADVEVADLLPALLDHLGPELADSGLAHGGWILQRLGEAPLDMDGSVGSLGLRDGETVYLRPFADQIPPVHFDDVIDGVAVSVADRSGLWRPEYVTHGAVAAGGAVAAAALYAIAAAGPPALRSLTAAALALLGLTGVLAFGRGLGQRAFGVLCAVIGVAAATLAGLIVPQIGSPDTGLILDGPNVLCGSTAALVSSIIVCLLLPSLRPMFVAVAVVSTCGLVAGASCTLAYLSGAQAAAVIAVLTTLASISVPLVAARLAKIRMAPLPTKPEHLQEDLDPEPSEQLLVKGAAADRFMTAQYAGTGIATCVALALVAATPGWPSMLLATMVSAVRLLMARTMSSAWHRSAAAVPALVGLATLIAVAMSHATVQVRLPLALVAVPACLIQFAALARTLSRTRLSPHWGRIGDVTQTVATVALVPVLLAVLDVYSAVRELGG